MKTDSAWRFASANALLRNVEGWYSSAAGHGRSAFDFVQLTRARTGRFSNSSCGCWHFDTPGYRVLFGGIARPGPEHQRLEQIEEARVILLLDVLDVPEPARANPLVRGMPAQPSRRWRIDRRGSAEQADAVAFEATANALLTR